MTTTIGQLAAMQMIEDIAEALTERDLWDVQARARAFIASGGLAEEGAKTRRKAERELRALLTVARAAEREHPGWHSPDSLRACSLCRALARLKRLKEGT